jgi:hypothetical protein
MISLCDGAGEPHGYGVVRGYGKTLQGDHLPSTENDNILEDSCRSGWQDVTGPTEPQTLVYLSCGWQALKADFDILTSVQKGSSGGLSQIHEKTEGNKE